MSVTLEFDVPYSENASGLTKQELVDYVVKHLEYERSQLVIEAKVLLIHALSGEFVEGHNLKADTAGSGGLSLDPGTQGLGTAPSRTEDTPKKVGWFGRVGCLFGRTE